MKLNVSWRFYDEPENKQHDVVWAASKCGTHPRSENIESACGLKDRKT